MSPNIFRWIKLYERNCNVPLWKQVDKYCIKFIRTCLRWCIFVVVVVADEFLVITKQLDYSNGLR